MKALIEQFKTSAVARRLKALQKGLDANDLSSLVGNEVGKRKPHAQAYVWKEVIRNEKTGELIEYEGTIYAQSDDEAMQKRQENVAKLLSNLEQDEKFKEERKYKWSGRGIKGPIGILQNVTGTAHLKDNVIGSLKRADLFRLSRQTKEMLTVTLKGSADVEEETRPGRRRRGLIAIVAGTLGCIITGSDIALRVLGNYLLESLTVVVSASAFYISVILVIAGYQVWRSSVNRDNKNE